MKLLYSKNPMSLIIFIVSIHAQILVEQCGRIARVNDQPVLVDLGGSQKGEGLSFLLEKDDIAKRYLDSYRKGNKINKASAILGSVGTISLFWGVFGAKDLDSGFVVGGASLMVINFLFSILNSQYNEKNLENAISEYNRRNWPKIEAGRSLNNSPLIIDYTRSF
jgi:hypothetical protein